MERVALLHWDKKMKRYVQTPTIRRCNFGWLGLSKANFWGKNADSCMGFIHPSQKKKKKFTCNHISERLVTMPHWSPNWRVVMFANSSSDWKVQNVLYRSNTLAVWMSLVRVSSFATAAQFYASDDFVSSLIWTTFSTTQRVIKSKKSFQSTSKVIFFCVIISCVNVSKEVNCMLSAEKHLCTGGSKETSRWGKMSLTSWNLDVHHTSVRWCPKFYPFFLFALFFIFCGQSKPNPHIQRHSGVLISLRQTMAQEQRLFGEKCEIRSISPQLLTKKKRKLTHFWQTTEKKQIHIFSLNLCVVFKPPGHDYFCWNRPILELCGVELNPLSCTVSAPS